MSGTWRRPPPDGGGGADGDFRLKEGGKFAISSSFIQCFNANLPLPPSSACL